MSLDSYRLTRQYTSSNPRKEMLREKKIQVNNLYEFAADREDNTLLNGKVFNKSPRIFEHKFVDTVHHKITVETIADNDWMECGDYLEFDGMIWLCLNSYSFHKLYCRATFMSCDWQIYWIDENGKLKSQYVIDQNATQYNSGESSDKTMTLGSAQHMLKMPYNDDTIMLDSPQRFCIDRNIKKPTCYKVTQNDNTSYNYGKGLCCITVMETQLNLDKDKLITLDDGKQVWVCDYAENKENDSSSTLPSVPEDNPNGTTVLRAEITGSSNLRIGVARTYTATLMDKDGNAVPWNNSYSWNVASDFDVMPIITDNTIKLFIEDEDYVSSLILLQVIHNGQILTEFKVTVIDSF